MGLFRKSDIEKIENYINKGFEEEINTLSECRIKYEEIKKERSYFGNSVKRATLKNLGEVIEENEKAALKFLSKYNFLTKPETFEMKNIVESSKTARNTFLGIPNEAPSEEVSFVDDNIKTIRELSAKIEDTGMRRKLADTESYLTEIWKKQPENSHHDIYRKLGSYYLPTAEKLLNTYIDVQNKPGSNAETIKAETEKGIDTLNQALINVVNDTYGDTATDISTESNVLAMVARRDGLIKDDDFDQ